MDLAALIGEGIAVVRDRAAAHGIALAVEPPDRPLTAALDVRKARQVIFNLLSNAVKFAPDGGHVAIRWRLATRAEAVANALAFPEEPGGPPVTPAIGPGPFVAITVADDGPGVAPADRLRAFQPFVQLDATLARKHEGTGLGLALVRRLVALHGGGIGLQEAASGGAAFQVWLPCHPPEET